MSLVPSNEKKKALTLYERAKIKYPIRLVEIYEITVSENLLHALTKESF